MPLVQGVSASAPAVVGSYPQPLDDPVVYTWIAPDGSIWPLTTPELGWHLLAGIAGAQSVAPISVTTDAQPRGGAKVRHVQPQPRQIVLPIRVEGTDQTQFLSRWRPLANAFAQTRRLGPGTLQVSRPDGSTRQIAAYYEAGYDGDTGAGWYYDTATVSLFCEDPYWQDIESTVITRQYQGAVVDFLTPSFPAISSSQTLGATTATNPGDVEAWPTWTITGPASGITATNNTTGEAFTLTPVGGAMTGGQTVTITTDPTTVVGPDGTTSWIGGINYPSAVLWALQPGTNDVTFTVSGSGSGTEITLTFFPRYETA